MDLKKLKSNLLIKKITPFFIPLIIVLGYLFLTLPAVFNTHHWLMNLEPYPDGMLYTLAGRNLVLGKGLQLVYQQSILPLSIPKLYPVVLALGYLLSSQVQMFYVVNLILGVICIICLWQLLLNFKLPKLVMGASLILYVFSAYILILPGLPITENLSLCLFIASLWQITIPKLKWRNIALAIIFVTAFVLTRYAVFFVGLTFLSYLALRILKNQTRKMQLISLALMIISAIFVWLIFKNIGRSPFELAFSVWKSLHSNPPSPHFSFVYTPDSLHNYLRVISGQSMKFLWWVTPMASPLVWLAAAIGLLKKVADKHNPNRWNALIILLLFLAQWPLILILNGADARYLILSLPILAVGLAWFFETISKSHIKISLLIFLIILISQVFTQKPLLRQLISANLFHSSTAWQYEAIKSFNQTFTADESLLITALPPFLVDAYSNNHYQVLPLSQKQEFLAKKEYVWGSDVPYENLIAGYKQWLEQGKRLYISNAYVTHQQQVIKDYEEFKSVFDLTLVKEDCSASCNLYELHLKKPLKTTK